MSDLDIATVCYAANKAWNDLRGEDTLPFDEVRDSIIDGVRGAREGNTPEQSHENWLAFKVEHGWVYGERKDPVAKTHPLMVPYGDLPPEQRVKDDLFLAIVTAMSSEGRQA